MQIPTIQLFSSTVYTIHTRTDDTQVAAISAAVQLADTLVIRNAAATIQFSLSMSG